MNVQIPKIQVKIVGVVRKKDGIISVPICYGVATRNLKYGNHRIKQSGTDYPNDGGDAVCYCLGY